MVGHTTLNVKFWVTSGPAPLLALQTSVYGEPLCVPAAGVPAIVAVLLPLSVSVTLLGNAPLLMVIVFVGKPVVGTEYVCPVFPGANVVLSLAPLVNAGGSLTTTIWLLVPKQPA